jgi:hypothetical protein
MSHSFNLSDVVEHSDSKVTQIVRKPHLADKIVFVDGQEGCGKTLFTPILASFERVELLTYAYELEYICILRFLKKIEMDAAETMVRMLTDLQLYNTMMSRETNFRPSDLSSAFRDINSLRYLKRLFQKGDESVPGRITQEKPILNLCVHNLLGYSEPVFRALGSRAVLLEIVRHPLYMIKQQILSMEDLIDNPRDFRLYFQCGQYPVPYFAHDWENLFARLNNTERSIYCIKHLTQLTEKVKHDLKEKYHACILTIPFECFVLNPWPYMEQIKDALGSRVTIKTKRMLKRQNIPRRMYAEGIGLPIYKRCGWQLPQGKNENEEFKLRRNFAKKNASTETMVVLDQLCEEYEEKYLGGKKSYK